MNDIRPAVLDLSRSDDELRESVAAALCGTLTPMLCLVNHKCEAACASLADSMRSRIAARGEVDPNAQQQACDLDGECAADAAELRRCLRGVAMRALSIALNEERLEERLAERSLDLQGRLCLRVYPPKPTEELRLGAHVDSTLVTLLWSDGPGLEVLDPVRAAEWSPDAVLRYGLPIMGDADAATLLRDDQWARVQL